LIKAPKKAKALTAPPASQAAPVTYQVAVAIKALRDGAANEGQQKMALEWIIGQACGKRYFPYHNNERDTNFALGRLFVAEQIVGLFYIDIKSLRDEHEREI
jgi:hypothetical protein